jgi:hypothetical protein
MDDFTRFKIKQLTQGTACATCERTITVARWRLSIEYIAAGGAGIEPTESVFCSLECLSEWLYKPLPGIEV